MTSLPLPVIVAIGVSFAGCSFPHARGDTAPANLTRDSTELAVLTYNVKALPFPLGGWRKGHRMQSIRSRFRGYDLVLIQEAFTAHDDLLAGLDRRGTVTSQHIGVAQTGDGLTRSTGLAIAAFAPLAAIPFHTIGHFGVCSGRLTRANDCLVSKGFIVQRVQFAGHEIDVYDTHLDADRRDQPTRERQLATLEAEIRRLSADRPLIVAGDFNIERGDTAQFPALRRFSESLGLSDSDAQPGTAWRERLDYIFFRGSADVTVSLVRAGYDPGFRSGSRALSDHPALFAILRLTTPARSSR